VLLVVASFALLGTPADRYEPQISADRFQSVELSGNQPIGSTTVRLLVSREAIDGLDSAMSSVLVTADANDPAGGIVAPELRVTGVAAGEAASGQRNDQAIAEWRLGELCPAGDACDVTLELTVEWLNAIPDTTQHVTLEVEAGIDYGQESDVPGGATIALEVDDPLAVSDEIATLRARTEPDTVNLSADAPFAMRHVTVDVAEDVVPDTGDEEKTQTAIFAVSGLEGGRAVARVWSDDDERAQNGNQPGSEMPLSCEPVFSCQRGYTLVLEWTGREPLDTASVTWDFTSILRFPDSVAAPEGSMTARVDRFVDTMSEDGDRLTMELSDTIRRSPADPPVQVGTEPGDGPHTFVVDLRTWTPVSSGRRVGVPTTGAITFAARSADGSPLQGPVRVDVVTQNLVVNLGSPYVELTPDQPEQTLTVLPTRGCVEVDPAESGGGDRRCTVPFELYVRTPSEETGPVIVEWSAVFQAIEIDILRLRDGDLSVEMGG